MCRGDRRQGLRAGRVVARRKPTSATGFVRLGWLLLVGRARVFGSHRGCLLVILNGPVDERGAKHASRGTLLRSIPDEHSSPTPRTGFTSLTSITGRMRCASGRIVSTRSFRHRRRAVRPEPRITDKELPHMAKDRLAEVLQRLGGRHRPRDPHRAHHAEHQDVLRLPGRVRRRAQHARVPGVPRPARRAAGAQPGGRSSHTVLRGSRDRVRDRALEPVPPQAVLLSRHAQGLPDLPVRPAVLRRRASSTSRSTARWPSERIDAQRRAPAGRRRVRRRLGYTTRIGITRIHLEEDTGKMVHVGGSGRPHRGRHASRSWTSTAPARRSSSS